MIFWFYGSEYLVKARCLNHFAANDLKESLHDEKPYRGQAVKAGPAVFGPHFTFDAVSAILQSGRHHDRGPHSGRKRPGRRKLNRLHQLYDHWFLHGSVQRLCHSHGAGLRRAGAARASALYWQLCVAVRDLFGGVGHQHRPAVYPDLALDGHPRRNSGRCRRLYRHFVLGHSRYLFV